ncbi:uncharacterized protein LOC128242131 [Mya arenaria]|uniref:uncharacterized protein LOC128242131 n=1 Tax=Mya arenaria TaxID=6604 RepID=UPI0022E01F9E|nr:uncharacterized protein LOC128242131 [Mya arenaria]
MPLLGSADRYEALSSCNDSVVYAVVSGFVEKKQKYWFPDYLYVLEIYWTSKTTTYAKRSYSDIITLQEQLLAYFSEKYDAGLLKSPVYVPRLQGKKMFRQNSIDLAEQREAEIQNFFRELLGGNPLVSSNKIVIDFLSRRHSDPTPSTSGGDNHVTSGEDDDDGDDVLFDR